VHLPLTQGTSGFFAERFTLTSAFALSIAASRCASAGWFALKPFSTVAGYASARRFQKPGAAPVS
jgi:hypothetical protein